MNPSGNSFTVLTLIVAPAVLTNATSVMALNTANRFGRVVDRWRALGAELRTLAEDTPLHAVRLRQLQRLRFRGQLLMRAQSAIYTALGSFVATALIAVLGAALSGLTSGVAGLIGIIGLSVGVIAASSLVYGCILIVRETRLALAGMREDMAPFGNELSIGEKPPSA